MLKAKKMPNEFWGDAVVSPINSYQKVMVEGITFFLNTNKLFVDR